MGGIVAAFSERGDDVVPLATKMLRVIDHRNGKGCQLSSWKVRLAAKSPDKLNPEGVKSNICIGQNVTQLYNPDSDQNALVNESSSILEGRIYSVPRAIGPLSGPSDLQAFAQRCDGDYILATIGEDEFAIYRDPVGIVPLYFAEDQRLLAFASEKKSLWAAGLHEVNSFPPGCILEIHGNRREMKRIRAIAQSRRLTGGSNITTRELVRLVAEAVCRRTEKVGELALAFSGGLDSGVLSKILQKNGIPVHLICVGLNDSVELSHAETVASDLDLPIDTKVLEKDEVKKALPDMIWHLEDTNPMKVCLGAAFYFVAQEASRLGKTLLMSGQGCDELFGGYLRHLTVFKEQGAEAFEKNILSDVRNAYEASYGPTSHACAAFGVEHTAPYADMNLIDYALGIPAEQNFGDDRALRKAVLRDAAKQLGFSEAVYDKPKKAIQYGSGVDRILRKIAQDDGLRLGEYLGEQFTKVFALDENRC